MEAVVTVALTQSVSPTLLADVVALLKAVKAALLLAEPITEIEAASSAASALPETLRPYPVRSEFA